MDGTKKTEIKIRREREMKNIDLIKNASEDELIELLHTKDFDCDERCPDFWYGCRGKCNHDYGRDFIREWLNTEV